MIPWAHPSQYPERHHDRFSRFRTDRATDQQTMLLCLQQVAASSYNSAAMHSVQLTLHWEVSTTLT